VAGSKLTLIELLKHLFHVLLVCGRHFGEFAKIPFAFLGLLRQNVAFVSMLPLDLTGAGFAETLLGSGF
jgi:hypothetical protein